MHSQCCATVTSVWFPNIFFPHSLHIKQSLCCPPRPRPPSPWQPAVCFLSLWIYLSWLFHINRIIQYVTLCVWLSLNIMFLRFINVAACISGSLIFMAGYYSTVGWTTGYLFIMVDTGLVPTCGCCRWCCEHCLLEHLFQFFGVYI